jgi:ferredoxin
MEALKAKAAELLNAGTVQVVIGYAAGTTADHTRPHFARTPEHAAVLVWNEHCAQNLATYLLKPEVKALGKPALVSSPATLRALLQLAAENQVSDGSFVALACAAPPGDGALTELSTCDAIEEYLATVPRGLSPEVQQELETLWQKTPEQRWAYWSAELARCIRCYACRAACPLCYCSRCIVDQNQPQWLPVAATEFGNLEWNVVRAMHLAGRCIDCGSCAAACPVGIRLDLLNHVLAQDAQAHFGAVPGYTRRKDYALATFKADDREDFIR